MVQEVRPFFNIYLSFEPTDSFHRIIRGNYPISIFKGKIMSVTQITTVRRGFTLVELLVVIAIIGVLMGLLMPAIVNARLAALQATCANNERELAQAMILFDSNKDHLPYVGRSDNNYSWYTQILEELGLGKLADNPTAQPVKQFKCPVGDSPVNSFSYMGNVGNSGGWGLTNNSSAAERKKWSASGLLFFYNGNKTNSYTKSSISSCKDGASLTILLSEKCYQRVPGHSGNIATTYSPYENWVQSGNRDNACKRFGLIWNGDSVSTGDYSNYPTSRHSQVNNVAFADGSVRAVSKAIYYNTYKSLMCPCDIDAGLGNINLGADPNFK